MNTVWCDREVTQKWLYSKIDGDKHFVPVRLIDATLHREAACLPAYCFLLLFLR